MSLAQESGFRPKSAFREKMAWDMPTRDVTAAERAVADMREQFSKASKAQKREMHDLTYEASRVLIHLARNRRKFTKQEQANFLRIAAIYSALKSEFASEVR